MLSCVASPMRPNLSDIPYCVTIDLAIFVAFSISLAAPVVTVSKTSSSAALPARKPTIISWSSAFVLRYFSSSGTCIT